MLCTNCSDFCACFDLDVAKGEGGILHYSNYADLVASAKYGCEICIEIRRQKEKKEPPGTYDDRYRAYGTQIRYVFREQELGLYWIQGDLETPYIAYMDICTAAGEYPWFNVPSNSGLKVPIDDPLAGLIWTRPTHEDAWSPGIEMQMKKWLKICRNEHKLCQEEAKLLPTRLIDVGDANHEPFLFVSDGHHGIWVTLSYCWGQAVPVKTERTNLDKRRKQISMSELPPLFKDAIDITRSLGYQYLWVDSLCIIQDSYDDWVNESANMGNIFKNSSLTLAAEASENTSVGLYQGTSKARRRLFQVSCHSKVHNLKGTILLGRNRFGDPPFRGPLSTRTWTLQETTLARRVIRFARGQIWWRCHVHECNERDPDAFHSSRMPNNTMWQASFLITREYSYFRTPTLRNQLRNFWYLIVKDFTSRRVTYATDVLPAISGLAKEVQRHFPQRYIAGLWLNDIHRDILWCSPKKGAIMRNVYVAPSWSWASIDFSSSWKRNSLPDYDMFDSHLLQRKYCTPIAEFLDVTVKNVRNDPFGQIETGHIRIRAPFHEVCSCHMPEYFFDCQPISLPEDDPDYYCDHDCKATCRPYDSNVETFHKWPCCKVPTIYHETLLFLHISSARRLSDEAQMDAYGLILKCKNQQENEFQRIGRGKFLETVKTSEIWPSQTIVTNYMIATAWTHRARRTQRSIMEIG